MWNIKTYRSLNTVRVIESRNFRWAGHVARMEEGMIDSEILTGTPSGKRTLGRPSVDGWTILEWILKKKLSLQNKKVNIKVARLIKSRTLIWAGHVARMEEGRTKNDILRSNNLDIIIKTHFMVHHALLRQFKNKKKAPVIFQYNGNIFYLKTIPFFSYRL